MNQSAFFKAHGSTEGPGVTGTIFMGRPVSAYTISTPIAAGHRFVIEYISAVITHGNQVFPAEYMNLYGAVGFQPGKGTPPRTAEEIAKGIPDEGFHFLPFTRSEPFGMLVASQSLNLSCPHGSQMVVKVPMLPNQSGGAEINISGYFTTAA